MKSRKNFKQYSIKVIVFCSIILCFSCARSNESNDRNRFNQWRNELDSYRIPQESIQLNYLYSIPNESQTNSNNVFLKKAQCMAVNEKNEIYLADTSLNQIIILDAADNIVNKFGKYGQGPGDLFRPYCLAFYQNNSVVISNSGNGRLDIFDSQGIFIRSIKVFKNYSSIATDNSNRIYAAPITNEYRLGNYLIDVLDSSGNTINKFGLPVEFKYHSGTLNRVGLRIRNNEIFVYWLFLNLLRRYDQEGKLIREYKIADNPLLTNHSTMNELAAIQKYANKFRCTIRSIWVESGSIYLFSYDPRIEILEYDYDGKLKEIYWANQKYDSVYSDLFVKKSQGMIFFYLLEVFPNNRINVFSKK